MNDHLKPRIPEGLRGIPTGFTDDPAVTQDIHRIAGASKDSIEKQIGPQKVVLVYAPKDAEFAEQAMTHFKSMEKKGLITLWSEAQMAEGENAAQALKNNLKNASIIIALVSADLLASDTLMAELVDPTVLAKTQVVMVRACDITDSPLERSRKFAQGAIVKNSDADTVWGNITGELRESLHQKPASSFEAGANASDKAFDILKVNIKECTFHRPPSDEIRKLYSIIADEKHKLDALLADIFESETGSLPNHLLSVLSKLATIGQLTDKSIPFLQLLKNLHTLTRNKETKEYVENLFLQCIGKSNT